MYLFWQDLVEKVMILRKAVEVKSGSSSSVSSSILADKLSEYAHLLAAQGKLTTATNYLGDSTQVSVYMGCKSRPILKQM